MVQTPVTKGSYQTSDTGLLDIHQDTMLGIHILLRMGHTHHKDIPQHLAHILHMRTLQRVITLMSTHHLYIHLLVDTHQQVILVLVLLPHTILLQLPDTILHQVIRVLVLLLPDTIHHQVIRVLVLLLPHIMVMVLVTLGH